MKNIPNLEHLELLPKEDSPIDFALDVLVYSKNTYLQKWLLLSHHFLEHFANRWHRILNAAPQDADFRRTAQIEFAFIAHELNTRYSIDLYSYIERVNSIVKQTLSEKDTQKQYFVKLQEAGIQLQDLENPVLIGEFLDFLYEQSQNNFNLSCTYIRTCIELTQLPGWVQIFDKHIKSELVKFDTDQIEPFLESNSYLWKDDIDQHINQLMVEASVTYIQASNMIAMQEMEYACLHAFMDILYYKNN